MIIDLILDRKDAEETFACDRYDAHKFYMDCMCYGEDAFAITRAMDEGAEEDVVNALCTYIDEQEYNPDIKDYIRSKRWLNPYRKV